MMNSFIYVCINMDLRNLARFLVQTLAIMQYCQYTDKKYVLMTYN